MSVFFLPNLEIVLLQQPILPLPQGEPFSRKLKEGSLKNMFFGPCQCSEHNHHICFVLVANLHVPFSAPLLPVGLGP